MLPPAHPPPTPGSFACEREKMGDSQEIALVGLVNQAMTCYLNSLLQTLYMTPEFRNALYRWEHDGLEEEAKSIPFQLQKLFLQLQTSSKTAVGTTELTKSFGWDSSEAWQQHDVQELCRVMFDALEKKFKKTDQADLISCLYEGKLKDYVKCLECGHESAREDTFLDVPLVVRPWGSTEAYKSVVEALAAFVSPEKLDGSNQYSCEQCKKKCDAHKGLRFLKLPYLLTMQLKRFDFDPSTMHRIKLNDRVSFPDILDLSFLLKPDSYNGDLNDDADTTDSGSALDEFPAFYNNGANVASKASPSVCSSDGGIGEDLMGPCEEDEGVVLEQRPSQNELGSLNPEKAVTKIEDKYSPNSYELFSIMVHSGSANGGHYYAYIKLFECGEWYCFNDNQVTKATAEEISKTYGGGESRGYYSTSYSSSTNAYMLMYRLLDKEKNSVPMRRDEFPAHLQKILLTMAADEEKEKEAREREKEMCHVKLLCNHPIKKTLVDVKLKVHKDETLAEATEKAHFLLHLNDHVDLEDCRLIIYDEQHDSMERSFEGSGQVRMEEILGGVRSSYSFELMLEIKKTKDKFLVYKPGGVAAKVFVIDIDTGLIRDPMVIRSHQNLTVDEFKAQVAKALDLCSSTSIRAALEKGINDVRLLQDNDKTLKEEDFDRNNKIFVEFKDEEDISRPFEDSKFYQLIMRHKHTINLIISLPKIDNDVLASWGIPNQSDSELAKAPGDNAVSRETSSNVPSSGLQLLDDPPDSDEGLGDSMSSYSAYQGVSCPTIVSSDQSEDSSLSSLTDSERTLIGDDLSPRNISPDLAGQEDFENDDNPQDPTGALCSGLKNAHLDGSSYYWDMDSSSQAHNVLETQQILENQNYYFKALPYTEEDSDQKMVRVNVDKRITLGRLKKELEPLVGINQHYFKLYRHFANNQEFECTPLTENLMNYFDDAKISLKLGRALRKGEFKVKIYQLLLNETEPIKFLFEWILSYGMTIQQAKIDILAELKNKNNIELPLNRCRLRRKNWKCPGGIFLDHLKFNSDIPVYTSWEIFLEILDAPDTYTLSNLRSVLVRHWHPSTFMMDKFQEVIVQDESFESFRKKISELSGIEECNLEFAKPTGTFPFEVQRSTIQKELDWRLIKPNSNISSSPLQIKDDGQVIYFRDKTEEVKKLTDEEKRELAAVESSKCNRITKSMYSPRKEKALKIYTADSPPASSSIPHPLSAENLKNNQC